MGRYGNSYGYGDWAPYVPVAQRKAHAVAAAKKLAKKEGREPAPVQSKGRKMTTTFWGQAWCENLAQYSNIANRLPRGRTYLGNGSVADLVIEKGSVRAIVGGSEVYRVTIKIKTLAPKSWKAIRQDCSQSIHSALELLQGRFDQQVMQRLTEKDAGLFPQPKEIEMRCSCPDGAYVCKHIAAVMYGVGVRLDTAPELLFTLRNVDHLELISQAASAENLEQTLGAGQSGGLAGNDLGELFGIDLESTAAPSPKRAPRARTSRKGEPNRKAAAPTAVMAGKRIRARVSAKRKPISK